MTEVMLVRVPESPMAEAKVLSPALVPPRVRERALAAPV